MAGLVDVIPHKETTFIQGIEINVTGVNLGSIGFMWGRFPALAEMVSRREFDIPSIMGMGPEFVGAVIAAGTGYPNDPEAEAIARALSLDEQVDLLARILRISLPRGVGPFVDSLVEGAKALGMRPSQVSSATAEKTSGKSPESSKPSSQQATAA